MADTYIAVSGYDIGCDECGWYDTVESESTAERLTRDHACEVEALDGDEDTTSG